MLSLTRSSEFLRINSLLKANIFPSIEFNLDFKHTKNGWSFSPPGAHGLMEDTEKWPGNFAPELCLRPTWGAVRGARGPLIQKGVNDTFSLDQESPKFCVQKAWNLLHLQGIVRGPRVQGRAPMGKWSRMSLWREVSKEAWVFSET